MESVNLYPQTVDDLLQRWDNGESFFTIEMGGLGPGYEQAIQITAIEIVRDGKEFKPSGDNDKDTKDWDTLCTATLKRINEKVGGLSGAQYSAASWLAWQWCHNGGVQKLIERCKEKGQSDRVIQVSKFWPKGDQL